MMFFTSKISMVPHLLNPKLVSISDIHFTSIQNWKTVQMKLMKASSKTSACLPYLLVSPAWLSRDLNRLSSLLQRQLPSLTQCTLVISIWGAWWWGPWWWWFRWLIKSNIATMRRGVFMRCGISYILGQNYGNVHLPLAYCSAVASSVGDSVSVHGSTGKYIVIFSIFYSYPKSY